MYLRDEVRRPAYPNSQPELLHEICQNRPDKILQIVRLFFINMHDDDANTMRMMIPGMQRGLSRQSHPQDSRHEQPLFFKIIFDNIHRPSFKKSMKTASTSITITAVVGFGKTVVIMTMSIIKITIITNLNDKQGHHDLHYY